jgi:hypothetical protein
VAAVADPRPRRHVLDRGAAKGRAGVVGPMNIAKVLAAWPEWEHPRRP